MSFLKSCCICLNKSDLKRLFDMDNDGVSHFNKLTSSIAEMNFKEMNDQRLICGECRETLNTVYNFRQMSLRSKTNLINHLSQLQTSSHVTDTIQIKKEIEIKCENEGDSFEDPSESHCLVKIKSDPDDISASNKCFICRNESDLKHMFDVDNDGVSHYDKLVSSIAEMNFEEMNNQRLICGECCVTLNTVHNFRQMCLRSKTNLITYLSQRLTSSNVTGKISNPPINVKTEFIEVKKEIESEDEDEMNMNEDSKEENNSQDKCQTKNDEERIQFPASVKKECESEEDASSAHEDATANDVKIEEFEHQPMMEEENFIEFTKIEVQEDPLGEVKEEPMSDTETPKDGSTSQADAGTPEEVPFGYFQCELCKQIFNRKGNLTNHMRKHSGVKPYECEVCQRRFMQRGHLTMHKKLHNEEKPFECEICQERFRRKGALNVHMYMHSTVKQYECKICQKVFSEKDDYTKHLLTHSEERPHNCDICHKNFIHKKHLKTHMRFHSDERPFECEICKKTFILKGILDMHMKIHSDERPYECEICKKRFKRKNNLNVHISMQHSNDKTT